MMNILITGGAGFIGQHLARFLVERDISVTILDNFLPQVHGQNRLLPRDLDGKVRLIQGDVADAASMREALVEVDRVVHLAAETGTGQSMYEIARYSQTNLNGTAQLFEILTKDTRRHVKRVVLASSRAIYGEGAYECLRDGLVYPQPRSAAEKAVGNFDPCCPICSGPCAPAHTPETAPAQPSSFYGLTKLTQEQMALLFGRVLGIPTVALRYQNVYGPGQSLENPYTGILAVFSNRARTGSPIQIFEDGAESRDFVYVEDVVRATATALLAPLEGQHSVNVGSGQPVTVLEVANLINARYGGHSHVEVTGSFREGDIRHGIANLQLARNLLHYEPAWSFQDGVDRFLSWAESSAPSVTGYEDSLSEMKERGLFHV